MRIGETRGRRPGDENKTRGGDGPLVNFSPHEQGKREQVTFLIYENKGMEIIRFGC